MKTSSLLLVLTLEFAAFCAPRAQATVLLDQIGSSGTAFTGQDANVSQFVDDDPTFSIAALDDFTISSAFRVTNISAALLGFNGFTSFNNVTGYELNIYSSLAAANANLNGDVAHLVLGPGQVTLTMPFGGDSESALLSAPVSFLLPSAGSYYVSVVADLDFGNGGQLGVYSSSVTSGGANGYQENPGGDFNFPGNQMALGVDLAYRVTGDAAPEPATWCLLLGGLGMMAAMIRRRRMRLT